MSGTIRTHRLGLLAVAVLTLLVSGCGGRITQSNYERIKDGMTEKEVAAILGAGKETQGSGIDLGDKSLDLPGGAKLALPNLSLSGKIVKWEDGNRSISVLFLNGKVASKAQVGL